MKPDPMLTSSPISPISEIISEIAAGKMVILMDDEGRENEGDLIIAAEFADAKAINFMAKFGRGLICLALPRSRAEELALPMMAAMNRSRHETAFTVSIEAREGITTGISAADRSRTIRVAIDKGCSRSDLVTPGHVFPLVARDGGVLVRSGHTEAAVDLARLAGGNEACCSAGVICEIMNDDGTMARLPDLVEFANNHQLKVGTIADLIAFRRQSERLVTRGLVQAYSNLVGGEFTAITYSSPYSSGEQIALIKGSLADLANPELGAVLVRVHAINLIEELLTNGAEHAHILRSAMRKIGTAGRGVVVLIRDTHIDSKPSQDSHPELRYYGIGAQILSDLGVSKMILLSNTKRQIVGIEGFGLTVTGQETIGE